MRLAHFSDGIGSRIGVVVQSHGQAAIADVIQELRRLANDPQSDEAQLKERLKALGDLDARTLAEVARAFDAINQGLDARQQAKFRVFEENMERRKLELVTRARQANRPKP